MILFASLSQKNHLFLRKKMRSNKQNFPGVFLVVKEEIWRLEMEDVYSVLSSLCLLLCDLPTKGKPAALLHLLWNNTIFVKIGWLQEVKQWELFYSEEYSESLVIIEMLLKHVIFFSCSSVLSWTNKYLDFQFMALALSS